MFVWINVSYHIEVVELIECLNAGPPVLYVLVQAQRRVVNGYHPTAVTRLSNQLYQLRHPFRFDLWCVVCIPQTGHRPADQRRVRPGDLRQRPGERRQHLHSRLPVPAGEAGQGRQQPGALLQDPRLPGLLQRARHAGASATRQHEP